MFRNDIKLSRINLIIIKIIKLTKWRHKHTLSLILTRKFGRTKVEDTDICVFSDHFWGTEGSGNEI